MHRKRVLYIQEGMQAYGRLARLTAELDAEFEVVSADAAARGLPAVDLVVCPTLGMHRDAFADFEQRLRAIENVALLFVVDPDALKTLRLPAHLRADFALSTSTDDELLIRMRHLLWPGEEMANSDFITVDSMVINLSTYQVLVDGSPVDFTYLEYALLAFLVTHSGHVYSRVFGVSITLAVRAPSTYMCDVCVPSLATILPRTSGLYAASATCGSKARLLRGAVQDNGTIALSNCLIAPLS